MMALEMTATPAPIDPPPVPDPIEGRCNKPVQECSLCEWRGQNYVGQPCKRCGQDAVIERPCRNYPVTGTAACRKHGSGTPLALAVGERRSRELEEAGKLGRLLAETGAVDEIQAHEVLARRMAFAEAMASALDLLVAELDPAGGDGAGRLWGPDHLGDQRPHVLVVLADQWTTKAAQLAKMALDHDIDAAKVRLEAADVDTLVGVFAAALAEAGLSSLQEQAVRRSLGEHLRQLAERLPE